MNTAVLKEMSEKSLAAKVTFPEVVKALLETGVESYSVDLAQNLKTYYASNGEVMTERFEFQGPKVAQAFSSDKVVSAIRDTQNGKITYQEFLHQIMEAGCPIYTAYLTGRKVIYSGRQGDFHVEHFPGSKK